MYRYLRQLCGKYMCVLHVDITSLISLYKYDGPRCAMLDGLIVYRVWLCGMLWPPRGLLATRMALTTAVSSAL